LWTFVAAGEEIAVVERYGAAEGEAVALSNSVPPAVGERLFRTLCCQDRVEVGIAPSIRRRAPRPKLGVIRGSPCRGREQNDRGEWGCRRSREIAPATRSSMRTTFSAMSRTAAGCRILTRGLAGDSRSRRLTIGPSRRLCWAGAWARVAGRGRVCWRGFLHAGPAWRARYELLGGALQHPSDGQL